MRSLSVSLCVVVVASAVCSAGCSDLLTPEKVREHLKSPTAAVDKDNMGKTARDFFAAKDVSGANALAFLLKDEQGESSNVVPGAALAAGASWQRAISTAGALETTGDVFCAVGLVASIATFEGCASSEDDCDVEVTIDSCVLRIGDEGDDEARGKIIFKLKNETVDDVTTSELRLSFEDFELSNGDDEVDYFDGLLAIENVTDGDSSVDTVLAADITHQTRRLHDDRFPIFDDGKKTTARSTAGVRFTANDGDTEQSVKVELLAFVDDDDNARNESIAIEFGADAKEVGDDASLVGADLVVRGDNGEFTCNWSAADEADGSVSSAGSCVDEDGEVVDFEAEVNAR